jgi:hypothetical protein
MGQSPGSKTLGGTPMVQSLSQQGISPSTGMMGFGTPAGLGLTGLGADMGTPGMAGLTPAMGVGTMPTMSELGLTVSGGQKRNEDEERKAKMRQILKSIGKPRGRVGEGGLARLARRFGFENDVDIAPGRRTVNMAGNVVMVQVALEDDVPQAVQVAIRGDSVALEEQNEKAGQVLLRNLQPENTGQGMGIALDRFSRNIEWMAKIDRNSDGSKGINCFDALSGVYSALRCLYEQELLLAKQADAMGRVRTEEKAKSHTLRKRSGCPVVHESGKLGLALHYWQNQAPVQDQSTTSSAMDVDGESPKVTAFETEPDTYSLRIEVERSSHMLYPAIRNSDAWLPNPLDLSDPTNLLGIPWRDPPPLFMSPESGDASANPQSPDLRFIAKLDPPLVMPFQTAVNIHLLVGAPAPQAYQGVTPAYHALLLHDSNMQMHTSDPFLSAQSVLAIRDGVKEDAQHEYRLNVAKPDFGFKLEELPFSHPKQLVGLLPTLRQWVCVGSLLKGMFTGLKAGRPEPVTNGDLSSNGAMSLDDVLGSGNRSPSNNVSVDITLATTPTPSLGCTLPSLESDGRDIEATVLVQTNGDLNVDFASRQRHDSTADGIYTTKRHARALEACNYMSVWLEWLRGEIAPA